jgi:hypothetical protein
MRKSVLYTVTILIGVLTVSANARADAFDIPAQVCKPFPNNSTPASSISYDINGVRNEATTGVTWVTCSLILPATTGRTLFIAGADQNSDNTLAGDFQCDLTVFDINFQGTSINVFAPFGTYTTTTFASVALPDDAVLATISCNVPPKKTAVSTLSDFWIQW